MLSKRIRAFAVVVLFLSLLPAAYLLGQFHGAKHREGSSSDTQANASGFEPLQKLDPPSKNLNHSQADPSAGTPQPKFPVLPQMNFSFGTGDPFTQMDQEMQAMQKRMDAIFGQMPRGLDTGFGSAFGLQDLGMNETNDAYVYRFKADGLDKGSLKVNVDDNQLSVSGEFSESKGQASASSSFSRMTSLPGPVDTESIQTDIKDGVLTITLKKPLSAPPRKHAAPMASSLLN